MIVPTLCPPWQQFIERGGVFKNLYRLRFRDGQYHWVASSGVSLTEKDGTIREWIGTFNDITGRKRAEEALRQKEEEYRSIFEQALEGIYRTTPEGKSLAANPALAKILGYTSTEELVTNITDTLGQMWADPTSRQTIAEVMERGEVVRGYECQFIRKDGQRIWVSVNGRAVRDDVGKTLYFEGFIEDINDRKLAEQKLRESESRERARAKQLETILSTIPIPVLIAHDPECREIIRNLAAWEQLGIAKPESDTEGPGTARELRHRILQDGTPIAKGQLPIERAAATGQPVYNVSTTLIREDGTERHEIGNAAPWSTSTARFGELSVQGSTLQSESERRRHYGEVKRGCGWRRKWLKSDRLIGISSLARSTGPRLWRRSMACGRDNFREITMSICN